jgi:glyoxylase-like metal-dependent hydrolase (beta-lactamase superfamily II)
VLPDNPLKELNSYLIRDPERSLLIDTGFRFRACREALLSGFAEIGEDPGAVDIFLTHLHADHSGLSSEIVGDDRHIYISEMDGAWLRNIPTAGDRWASYQSWDTLAGMPAKIVEQMQRLNPAVRFAPPDGTRYTTLRDGDVLHAGGYELRCVLTPGHSPGHMCLWDERNGLMFTGDHVLFDITPNITAWPSVDDSLGNYLDSLRAVREYPVKTAFPGHRKPGDFHARIEELFLHHDRRLDEVGQIVRENPGLTAHEIAGMMRWKIRATTWDEFPPSQKIFAVGECLSHLDYLRLRDVVSRELDGKVYRYFSCDAV